MDWQQADSAGGLGEDLDLSSALARSYPDGIVVVDRSGAIRFANGQLEDMFGYPVGQLVGQPVEVLLPLQQRQVHTAHRLRYGAAPHVRAMGQNLDLWGRRADGAEFPVEVALSPLSQHGLDDLVVATVRDISARRAAQEELRNIKDLLDGLHEAVVFGDADTFSISYANQAATTLSGYDRAELITMTPFHLLPALTRTQARVGMDQLRTEHAVTVTTALRRRDGTDITVECDVSLPAPARGASGQVVAVIRDIGDRLAKQAQEQAVAELMALVSERERIARDLHDTAIQELFGAGLTLQAALSAADPRIQERLNEVVEKQDGVIRQIRTAIFGLTARQSSDSLIDQVRAVVDEASRVLGFRPALTTAGPVDTLATPELTEQLIPVLREALSNVARHARASKVEVDLAYTNGAMALRVADDGVGLPSPLNLAGDGLRNLRQRAAELSGTVVIEANEPTGTVVRWTVPVVASPAA